MFTTASCFCNQLLDYYHITQYPEILWSHKYLQDFSKCVTYLKLHIWGLTFDSRVCHLTVWWGWRENWKSLPFLKVLKELQIPPRRKRSPLGKQNASVFLFLFPILQLLLLSIMFIIWAKQPVLKHFFKLPSRSIFNPLTSGLQFVDDFFLFDPPILEPDCNLPLREICRG